MAGTCPVSQKPVVAAVIVIIIIAALTAFAYSSSQTQLKNTLRGGLRSTAGVMATQINASDLAGLKPGDEGSPRYMAVATRLRSLRSMDDHIVNAYIMKVSPDGKVTFLVDDLYPDDPQGSAKIGEVSRSADKPEIFAALSGPTASQDVYTTRYGSFISGYAPIDDSLKDSAGNTTAVLGIDISAKDYTAYMKGKGNAILVLGLASILLALGCIYLFSCGHGDHEEKK